MTTYPGSDDLEDKFPGTFHREAREAIEEARQQDRDTLENDPFAGCYIAGMESDVLPSKRHRRISLERREY